MIFIGLEFIKIALLQTVVLNHRKGHLIKGDLYSLKGQCFEIYFILKLVPLSPSCAKSSFSPRSNASLIAVLLGSIEIFWNCSGSSVGNSPSFRIRGALPPLLWI